MDIKNLSEKDVIAICMANGVQDRETAEEIWGKLPKVKKQPREDDPRQVLFADDLRELSGMIDNVVIRQEISNGGAGL